MNSVFKNRTIGFYIALAASVVALVADILFIALDGTNRTFSSVAFVFMLAGSVSVLLMLFTDLAFAPVLQAGLFIAGFALELNATLPSVSDVWNGVNFIGGNATLGIIFTAVFFLCAVAAIVACFLPQRKQAA